MTRRIRVLEAIDKASQASASELCQALVIASNTMSTLLANLRIQGALEIVTTIPGPFGRSRSVYVLTAIGRRMLADPTKRVRLPVSAQKFPISSELRAKYKRDHEKHVELQRRLGIPEALIFGELLDASMPSTRPA